MSRCVCSSITLGQHFSLSVCFECCQSCNRKCCHPEWQVVTGQGNCWELWQGTPRIEFRISLWSLFLQYPECLSASFAVQAWPLPLLPIAHSQPCFPPLRSLLSLAISSLAPAFSPPAAFCWESTGPGDTQVLLSILGWEVSPLLYSGQYQQGASGHAASGHADWQNCPLVGQALKFWGLEVSSEKGSETISQGLCQPENSPNNEHGCKWIQFIYFQDMMKNGPKPTPLHCCSTITQTLGSSHPSPVHVPEHSQPQGQARQTEEE